MTKCWEIFTFLIDFALQKLYWFIKSNHPKALLGGAALGTPKRDVGLLRFMLAAALLGAVVAWPCLAVAAEQKIALVIGNSAYPTSRLRNPVNDAKAMADKLRSLGFDVILKTDASQREMTRSFSEFGRKLVPGTVSLFYYAGHGMQVRGKNFLIPVDADIRNEASVSSEAVDVDQLLNQLGPARLSVVILDACRNNPFESRFRAIVSGGLAQIDAPTGTLLAYATAPGKVASDGTGANGLYTEALLKALEMPGLKVEDVFKQVRINVVKASDGTQTPWESSSLTGEFYFTPDNKAAVADDKLKQSEKERTELTKALDEERKKRDKDAELVRAEMEKLRAELMQIRMDASATQSATAIQRAENDRKQQDELARAEAERERQDALAKAEAERKRVQELARAEDERRRKEDLARAGAERKRQEELERAEAALKKQQMLAKVENDRKQQEELARAEADLNKQQALAKAEAERKRQEEIARAENGRKRQEALAKADAELKKQQLLAQADAEQSISAIKPTGTKPDAPSTQVAMIAPPSSTPAALSAPSEEWKDRIALLEQLRDQLTFSKAMAILLDVSSPGDLTLLVVMENEMKSKSFHNAFAMGTSANGRLLWSGTWVWPLIMHASEAAVELCAKTDGDSCKVIMTNREFRRDQFLEVAKQFGRADVATVRQGYIAGIQKLPEPILLMPVTVQGRGNSVGYYSPR